MPESFVVNIAGGDTLSNKVSLNLNRAGDSPHSPMLKGLGIAVDVKLAPNVTSFEAKLGRETPASERILIFDQVGDQHYRLVGVVGEDDLGFAVSYHESVRQFLRLDLFSASYAVGEEKQFWVREDPEIELFFCAAGNVWCCDAANAYYKQGELFGLRSDPGEPPFEAQEPVEPATTAGSFIDTAKYAASAGIFLAAGSPSAAEATVTVTGEGTFTPGPDTFAGEFAFEFFAYHPITFRRVRVFSTAGQEWTGSGTYDSDTGEFAGTGAPTGSPFGAAEWEYADGGAPGGGTAFFVSASGGTFVSEAPEFDGQKYCDGPLPGETGVASTQLVPVGPDKIISLYVNSLLVEPTAPISVPIRIMDRWRDEFDTKHFGGAQYLSIFEEGLAEDAQGSLIANVYQQTIQQVTAIDLISVDPDKEYRLIFRFRSSLDDSRYVDKLVRLRVFRQEDLRNGFGDNLVLDDMPDVVYDADTAEWHWSGMDVFVAAFGLQAASIVVDQEVLALPLDDATAFPVAFADIRSLSYGGEVVVRFTRNYLLSNFAYEQTRCTYRVERPNGAGAAPVVVTKVMRRRDVGSRAQSFAPDVQFRVIEPDGATGTVYIEPIVNQIDFKQVVVWTEKGSVSLTMPLRSGQRYDITDIVDVSDDGKINQDRITVLTQTENSVRLLEFAPMSIRPRTRVHSGLDEILPEIEVDWPDINIAWPAQSEGGNDYELIGPADMSPPSFTLWGPKGIIRSEEFNPGGTFATIANGADDIMYIDSARFFVAFRASQTSAGTAGDHVVEYPTRPGSEVVPPSGVVDDDNIGLIYYDDKIILTKRPQNLVSITVVGPGGTKVVYSVELLTYAWIAVGQVTDGAASIDVSYTVYDETSMMNVTSGPFTVAEFIPLPLQQIAEFANNPAVWNTGRLLETEARMPKARINQIEKTIEFDFVDRFAEWIKWSVTNPLDRTILTVAGTPPIRTLVDIQRVFRTDTPYRLQNGQSVLVTFLHRDGPHVSALYKISGQWVEPVQLNNLRGRL